MSEKKKPIKIARNGACLCFFREEIKWENSLFIGIIMIMENFHSKRAYDEVSSEILLWVFSHCLWYLEINPEIMTKTNGKVVSDVSEVLQNEQSTTTETSQVCNKASENFNLNSVSLFATYFVCNECQDIFTCETNDIALHSNRRTLVCQRSIETFVWCFVCLREKPLVNISFGHLFIRCISSRRMWCPKYGHRALSPLPSAFYHRHHQCFQFDVNLAVCHLLSREMNYYLGQSFLQRSYQCRIHYECVLNLVTITQLFLARIQLW